MSRRADEHAGKANPDPPVNMHLEACSITMARRSKRRPKTRARRKRVLNLAEVTGEQKSKLFRPATEAVDSSTEICVPDLARPASGISARLWIARINAAARLNGLSYSKAVHRRSGKERCGAGTHQDPRGPCHIRSGGITKLAESAKTATAVSCEPQQKVKGPEHRGLFLLTSTRDFG